MSVLFMATASSHGLSSLLMKATWHLLAYPLCVAAAFVGGGILTKSRQALGDHHDSRMRVEQVRDRVKEIAVRRQQHRIGRLCLLEHIRVRHALPGSAPEIDDAVTAARQQRRSGFREVLVQQKSHATAS